jgi:hypothetical protein
VSLPPALAPLAAYRRFVTYRLDPHPDEPGKTVKKPTNWRDGKTCDAHNPTNQCSYAEAAATGRPVGFVIDEADGFWFLDIDNCLTPTGWSPLAVELCGRLAGAAVEVSQSGRGLHIIGRGSVGDHACRNIILGLELYTSGRFVALTGTNAVGDVTADLTDAIRGVAAHYFPPSVHGTVAGWTDAPVEGYGGPEDDDALLRAAMASGRKNAAAAFGAGHVTFEDIWTANADKLAVRWPGTSGGYDGSAVDGALAGHLAFWTGKNCERMRSLMLRSALVRDKWIDRPEYLEVTIMKACAVVQNVASAREAVAPPAAGSTAPGPLVAQAPGVRQAGREYLSVDDQRAFFAGCVYVIDQHKIWIPSTGDLLDKARFDVVYAGHVFPLDATNDKITDSAFDAFTKSRVLSPPTVFGTCFRPEHPPGAVVTEGNRTLVNTYIPIETRRVAGDPAPFLGHLAKMLPDENDRAILLNYMASLVQNPGVKFQWWPVIQGVEGNGKTLIDRVMTHCVGGRYSHLVNPDAMAKSGNQFNGWVQGNLYLGIEEIYVQNRRDFLDSFKATVTNDRVPIERKGVDQGTGDNRINGIMFTNHRDGVPVSVDTRRYAILYTAQQSEADLYAWGMMTPDYFPKLYDWFYGRRAYAAGGSMYGASIVNEFLRTFPLVAELDPAQLCVRAPRTSSTSAALAASLGRAEQEILEAVEEGRQGFAGGWISSIFLDRLLDGIRAPVPRHKRREMLVALGYDFHPGLKDGRVNNTVAPDHGKPRLYIRNGHLAANLTEASAIAKAYSQAQDMNANATAAARFSA